MHKASRKQTLRYMQILVSRADAMPARCITWPYSRDRCGYAGTRFSGKYWSVHRWVCTQVYGHPPTPAHHAMHSCGKGSSGCVNPGHLSWGTPKENTDERGSRGASRGATGEKNPHSVLKAADVAAIRLQAARQEVRPKDIASQYGISVNSASRVLSGQSWRHIQVNP